MRYDKTRGRWQSVRLGASAGFGTDNHVNVALMHHFAEGSTTAELRFSLRPSFASSTTAARYQAGGVGLTQEVRGVLAYDAELGRVVPSAREWLGRGGVTVRMFRDTDGNGSFDPGEELVPGASVRLRQPARIERQDGLVRIHDLLAYHRYEAEVDPATLLDPGWAPAFTTFSFVSDPNVYRNVDIPFQETGILEGFVLQRGNVGYNGVGGLRVFLRRVDGSYTTTLQTFSDGGFYAFGLPPGRYEVSLDTTQLRLLDVRAEPEVVAVEVRPVDGQGSSDLRFALEPRSSDAIRADVVADQISSAENMGPAAADRAQLLMAAETAEAEGELATSIELYHRILLQRPNDADVYLRIGHLLRALGDRTRALEAYRKTLSLAGRSIEAQRSLGLVLLELGEFVEAEQVLSQALVIDPSDLESRSALDELHGQAGSQP